MFKSRIFTQQISRSFSCTRTILKTNTSTLNKSNVHDLSTFLTAIGRNSIEHLETLGDLDNFLKLDGPDLKKLGIDVQSRKYLLRWSHKFKNDTENLREHVRGVKKNGGERKSVLVLAKKRAMERIEEREKFKAQELDAESRGERDF